MHIILFYIYDILEKLIYDEKHQNTGCLDYEDGHWLVRILNSQLFWGDRNCPCLASAVGHMGVDLCQTRPTAHLWSAHFPVCKLYLILRVNKKRVLRITGLKQQGRHCKPVKQPDPKSNFKIPRIPRISLKIYKTQFEKKKIERIWLDNSQVRKFISFPPFPSLVYHFLVYIHYTSSDHLLIDGVLSLYFVCHVICYMQV